MHKPSIADLRREYAHAELTEAAAHPDPFAQFAHWFEDAQRAGAIEPNAMTVSTITQDGRPTARILLLKGFDADGFVFYTNYASRKGRELAERPVACLNFWWPEVERQVRIEGTVERVRQDESDAYFQSRPRGSQLGAWTSNQSTILGDRGELEARLAALMAQYPGETPIPRPPHWGGYRVRPTLFEFWQGRPSRLHDRLEYLLQEDGSWGMARLSP